jgi:hypothetical protein
MGARGWSVSPGSPLLYMNTPLPQKPEPPCRSAHEDFFALDDNVYVPPDLGIIDQDPNGDAAVLLALD